MAIRTATSIWEGNLKEGQGHITSDSGALKNAGYSYSTRFEDKAGTNPEELLAAAHSACFSMALSGALEKEGYQLQKVKTEDKVHLEKIDGIFKITRVEIFAEATVPNIEELKFLQIAESAKNNCPVSMALKAIEITLHASLKTKVNEFI